MAHIVLTLTSGAQRHLGRRYHPRAYLGGRLYLAVILDAFSRRVVGWALADHLRTELTTAALEMALHTRRPPAGLIHHSNQGVQYVGRTYGQMLTQHGVRQSVGRPGTAWDKDHAACCTSFRRSG